LAFLGGNISFQSLNPEVLHNIGRAPNDLAQAHATMLRYASEGIQTYSEVILGLPGETLASFCEGIAKLIELGQHNGIACYLLTLLPNSQLASPQMRTKFDIQTVRRANIFSNEEKVDPDFADVTEYMDIVVATNTMSFEEREKAQLYMELVKSLHGFGLFRFIALYLHLSEGVPYQVFYMQTLIFAQQNPESLLGKWMDAVGRYQRATLSGFPDASMNLPGILEKNTYESRYIFCHACLELDRLYKEAYGLLQQYHLEPNLLAELLRYQKESIRQPNCPQKRLAFHYDFLRYFSDAYNGEPAQLQNRTVSLFFTDTKNPKNWSEFGFDVIFNARYSDQSFYRISYENCDALDPIISKEPTA
jgi:putative methyltransferase